MMLPCSADYRLWGLCRLLRLLSAHKVSERIPDSGRARSRKFRDLKTNLEPHKDRYRAICSAVWGKPAGLVVSEDRFRDGREWARTVREARSDEKPAMTAVNIGTLLNN